LRIPRKKKKKIPKDTAYCYTPTSGIIRSKGELPYYKIKTCIFYKHVDSVDNLDGYCTLLKDKITDKVKDCGLSDDLDFYMS